MPVAAPARSLWEPGARIWEQLSREVAMLGNSVGETEHVVALCLRLVGTVSAFRLVVDRSLIE